MAAIAERKHTPGVDTLRAAGQVRVRLHEKAEENKEHIKKIADDARNLLINPARKINGRVLVPDTTHELEGMREHWSFPDVIYATKIFKRKNQDGTFTRMWIQGYPDPRGLDHLDLLHVILDTKSSDGNINRTVVELDRFSRRLNVDGQIGSYNNAWIAATENVVADIGRRTARSASRAIAKKVA